MRLILRAWAVLLIAIRHLFSQPGLTLASSTGLVAVLALIMSVPLYADGIYRRLLCEGVFGTQTTGFCSGSKQTFTLQFRYIGSQREPVSWGQVLPLDQFLSSTAAAEMGLPQKLLVRSFVSDNVQLFAREDAPYATSKEPLTWAAFGCVSDLEQHITLLEGTFPAVALFDPEKPIEVLVGHSLAERLGLQVGEIYIAFARYALASQRPPQLPVLIAGIWQPRDKDEAYWFYSPAALAEQLLVPEQTFLGRLATELGDTVYLASWYLAVDASDIATHDVEPLLARITAIQQRASALLPGTTLATSPAEALRKYLRSTQLLTIQLYAFSVPIVGLLLAFLGLTGSLTVSQRRNEIATLRSRGATASQIVGMAVLERLVLGLVMLGVAIPLSRWLGRAIGSTTSFMVFSSYSNMNLIMTPAVVYLGVIAVGLSIAAQALPTITAARHTIVTYKQERARLLRLPWWQRSWLDLLLMIPAGYGVYLLRRQGSVVMPTGGAELSSDLFQNPLLFLVPALTVFSFTLLLLRLLPYIMQITAQVVSRSGSVSMLLALRYLSRSPGFYSTPMALLILTLSLSIFTASLAQTLDNHLYDRSLYKVGADVRVAEVGQNLAPISASAASSGSVGLAISDAQPAGAGKATGDAVGPLWSFLPISEYLKVPEVDAAARVGRFPAAIELSGALVSSQFLGIDRVDFIKAAFWRADFAPSSLGTLMNALAVTPEGVLLPRSVTAQHRLRVGDWVSAVVITGGRRNRLRLQVVGEFDLFPTWYPEQEGPLLVGNLEYLFEQAGNLYPYDIWLKINELAESDQVVENLRSLNPRLGNPELAWDELQSELNRPERQGLFGVLSIGFIAAALLAVLGFLLYALFSFRQRFVELGILRAIGLSAAGMTVFLACELAFLILVALGAGSVLGVWASKLFIPYLQVGAGPDARVPPYFVLIAWPAIARMWELLGILFAIALTTLAGLLMRIRIFQAVRLGEAI